LKPFTLNSYRAPFYFVPNTHMAAHLHSNWKEKKYKNGAIDFPSGHLSKFRESGSILVVSVSRSLLVFKIFFIRKYIKINFFYFLKIIFNISTSKWFENTKKILIWSKEKKNQIFSKRFLKRKNKQGHISKKNDKVRKSKEIKMVFAGIKMIIF
jgi:hypothetical protein